MDREQGKVEKSKVLILPTLILTETCQKSDQNAIKNIIPASRGGVSTTYYSRPFGDHSGKYKKIDDYSYNYFPVVLNGVNAPWKEANLYLLARFENGLKGSISTFHSIASDLSYYKKFLENEGLDPFEFPKRKLLRPTYRYRNSLVLSVQAGDLSSTTASRRVSSILGFYRWIIGETAITLSNPPWDEHDAYISINDRYGSAKSKKVAATDIAIKSPKFDDPYSDSINDAGELRPLPLDEQVELIRILARLGNVEMTLIHLISLFTGARIQTVLTLRDRHFTESRLSSGNEVRIKVGPSTMVDTKNGKRMVLRFPVWLFNKLRVYISSERAASRREKYKGDKEKVNVFLTNRGSPYYDSKSDLSNFDPSNTKRRARDGALVRQFISQHVLPLMRLRLNDSNYRYKFHDLRATFGMNLTEMKLREVQLGVITLHQARDFVRSAMGHEKLETTDLYLNHEYNIKMVRDTQKGYETHLEKLMNAVGDISEIY